MARASPDARRGHLLAPDKLATAMDTMGAAIDTVGGRFTMHYVTVVVTASRTTTA